MAARIKNLFHHKKDDEDTPDSPTQDKGSRRRFSRSDKHKPALRQSMDESDMVGSGAAGMHGRQSGTYSRGGPPQIGDLGSTSNSGGLQDGPLSSEFSRLNLDGTPGEFETSTGLTFTAVLINMRCRPPSGFRSPKPNSAGAGSILRRFS